MDKLDYHYNNLKNSNNEDITDLFKALEEKPLIEYFMGYQDEYSNNGEWIKYMSTLTQYESKYILNKIKLNNPKYVLDIGGNSGKFLSILKKEYLTICDSIVVDREYVCNKFKNIYKDIEYVPCDFEEIYNIKDYIKKADLIILKSTLHDLNDTLTENILDFLNDNMKKNSNLLIMEVSRDGLLNKFEEDKYFKLVYESFYNVCSNCFRNYNNYLDFLKNSNFVLDDKIERAKDINYIILSFIKNV